MSHIAATVAALARSADQATEAVDPCPWIPTMSHYAAMDSVQIPLSQRTSDELRARAIQLRCMASTATTADIRASLEALADRFAALAERREADERTGAACQEPNGGSAAHLSGGTPD